MVPFSDELYRSFRDLLLTRSGLYYPERKRADLLHGLDSAMTAGGYQSLAALYVDAHIGGHAWDLVLEHLTIGETYFFRNTPQFDALRNQIIPDIVARRAATRTIRIWSAGCATGEEPYSLAMLIGDLLPKDQHWEASILATDINPQFLARARAGLYGEWSFRETTPEQRARFFTPEQNRWRLRSEIRRMVNFARINLAEPVYPSIVSGVATIDLLICRNVTIYFDEETTRQVVDRFFRTLVPGGWLIVGHAEPQARIYHQFEVHNFPNTVVYRKPLSAPLFVLGGLADHGTSLAKPTYTPPPQIPPTRPPVAREIGAVSPSAVSQAAPSPCHLLVQHGRACANRGSWREAEQYCEQALAIDSLCIEAHYLLAQLAEHQGSYAAAVGLYRRTIYLNPNFVPGLIGMGHVWRRLGRLRDARRSYETTLEVLARLPAHTPIAEIEGATAGDLVGLMLSQLRTLE